VGTRGGFGDLGRIGGGRVGDEEVAFLDGIVVARYKGYLYSLLRKVLRTLIITVSIGGICTEYKQQLSRWMPCLACAV